MSTNNFLTRFQNQRGFKNRLWIVGITLGFFFILAITPPTMVHGDSYSEGKKEIEKLPESRKPLPREYPPAFDWRNVGGCNYVTSVENQIATFKNEEGESKSALCASCVAFAVVAALEANARIQLLLPVSCKDDSSNYVRNDIEFKDLSEAQLLLCDIQDCRWGWQLDEALDSCQNPGVLLKSLFESDYGMAVKDIKEWSTHQLEEFTEKNCVSKNSNKIPLRISGFIRLSCPHQMKKWISSKGPVVTLMYLRAEDILEWNGKEIYKCDNGKAAYHAVCCIGYDDIKQAWLCKNSLGKKWGDQGYFWVGYEQCSVDNEMFGIVGFIQIPVYEIEKSN